MQQSGSLADGYLGHEQALDVTQPLGHDVPPLGHAGGVEVVRCICKHAAIAAGMVKCSTGQCSGRQRHEKVMHTHKHTRTNEHARRQLSCDPAATGAHTHKTYTRTHTHNEQTILTQRLLAHS